MSSAPICEPLRLPPGQAMIGTRVEVPAGAARCHRFMHFHELSELVVYEKISGYLWSSTKKFAIGDGGVAFIPSMHHHDFELTLDKKRWVMVHFEPQLADEFALSAATHALTEARCVFPERRDQRRLADLAKWLLEEQEADPTSDRRLHILRLMLQMYAEAVQRSHETEGATHGVRYDNHRIGPLLGRISKAPHEPITLGQAARMCNLSPTYFSRYFKRTFGMTFSAYVRLYRLHLATRQLLGCDESIGEISDRLGFSQPSYFIAGFKQQFGITPRQYRMAHRPAHESP